jgi:hypothetical protein
MAALFAIGVITGTILSFEMGLLWPSFTATFGSVFGLGFAVEGFSFFIEAIFIGIYGKRRDHRLADGDRGQRLDEPPHRLSPRVASSGECVRAPAQLGTSDRVLGARRGAQIGACGLFGLAGAVEQVGVSGVQRRAAACSGA